MEKEKRLEDMSIEELATLLIDEPEKKVDIFWSIARTDKDMSELYKAVKDNMLQDEEITDDNDLRHNESVRKALMEIVDISGYNSIEDYEYDGEDREKLQEHYEKIWNLQYGLKNRIAFGYTIDSLRELCEQNGYTLEDFYDEETLKDEYKENGYEYNPEDGTITEIKSAKRGPSFEELFGNTDKRNDEETILMEAEEEYSDYLDSLETYKMGDNPEIDNKINECLKQGYLPSYIDTILEDYGYTLSPEDLKEMYYKCGFEYDIETGSARKIDDKKSLLQSKEQELSALEAEEKTISEAEALIAKQTEKDGQDIGEE